MINRLALPHYEEALRQAQESPSGEVSEMFLNQALGMAEYAFLTRDMSCDEFERETQRYRAIRARREVRQLAGVA